MEFERVLGEYLNSNAKIPPSPPFTKEGEKDVYLFESGRTALYAILMALGAGEGDEVLIQGFTCTAAVNPILWVGAKSIYVDVESGTHNMSPEDLEKKITPKSKIIIIQHTFGFPAKMDEILEIARQHNLIVLEDCAHSLGAEYRGRKIGTIGDASFFSFGRSKVISSVFGGAAFAKNSELAKKIREIHDKWQYPSRRWIVQQLFHPIYMAIAKPLYNFLGLGKIMIGLGKKLGLISLMVYQNEKSGGKPFFSPAKMPNALACLGIKQMGKLEKFNMYRRELAELYSDNLNILKDKGILRFAQEEKNSKAIFLNFPIQVKDSVTRRKCIKAARKQGIYLESWPSNSEKVIGPDSTNQEKLFYRGGSCPRAENMAQISISLPTGPNTGLADAKRVLKFLLEFLTAG